MSPTALLACLVAVLAWGANGLFDKLGVKGIDPLHAVLIRNAFSTAVIAGLCAATGRLKEVTHLEPRAYFFLALSGLLGSVLAQTAYYFAMKTAPVSQVVPITATYPVVAFLLAAFFLRESCTPGRFVGVLLVVVGLMLVANPGPDKAQAAQAAKLAGRTAAVEYATEELPAADSDGAEDSGEG
ncbi:MAG: EamA family transporter [Armatimonadia bacterium]